MMASAIVQINVVPKRLLKKSEASSYCGLSVKRFEAQAPFPPVAMPSGDLLYDVQDCDRWINSLKAGVVDDADTIIGKLGQ
jgi:hypothetical protein